MARHAKKRRFGSIETRGPRVHRIRWSKDGQPGSETVHGTLADAERRLNVIEIQLDGPLPDDTFSDFWEAVVWPSCAGLSPATRAEYMDGWEKWVEPALGHVPMKDITWRMVQRGVIDKVTGATKQRQCARLVSKICNMAVREGLLQGNPCSAGFSYKKPERRPVVTVDACSVAGFLDDVRGLKYEPVILAMLGGGLRLEEAAALQWEDLSRVTVRGKAYVLVDICKTLTTVKNRKTLQPFTKTDASRRQMLIGAPFAARMGELMDKGGKGPLVPSGDPLPRKGDPAGPYTSPGTLRHNWAAWVAAENRRRETARAVAEAREAGEEPPAHRGMAVGRPKSPVPRVLLGHMRKCWSTMQTEAGSPDSLIAKAMGHTDGTVRGRHYLEATLSLLAQLADNMEASIARNSG